MSKVIDRHFQKFQPKIFFDYWHFLFFFVEWVFMEEEEEVELESAHTPYMPPTHPVPHLCVMPHPLPFPASHFLFDCWFFFVTSEDVRLIEYIASFSLFAFIFLFEEIQFSWEGELWLLCGVMWLWLLVSCCEAWDLLSCSVSET